MSNWEPRTMPHFNEHQRSASVAGYQELMYSDSEPPKYNMNWMQRSKEPCFSSSMDVRQDGRHYNKFSWGSPGHYQTTASVSRYPESTNYSQNQRPFETAFKSAITKMKESSLSRLGTVDKNTRTSNIIKINGNNDINMYSRKCQTLQPNRKNASDFYKRDTGKKIFKCDSTSNKDKLNTFSVSTISKDVISDVDSDCQSKDNRYNSASSLSQDQNKITSHTSLSNANYSSPDSMSKSGTSIVIPVKDKKLHSVSKQQTSMKSETYISPTFTKTMKTSMQQNFQNNDEDNDDNLNFEPLPSVQEIISKVEAMNSQMGKNIMSKSLNITHEKPPLLISQRTSSQRLLDTHPTLVTPTESQMSQQKRMSGLYKKNGPNPAKPKSISNMPSDFQKLHLAFLEQRQEIQKLRQELGEKNALINQLETDLKNYEPWR